MPVLLYQLEVLMQVRIDGVMLVSLEPEALDSYRTSSMLG